MKPKKTEVVYQYREKHRKGHWWDDWHTSSLEMNQALADRPDPAGRTWEFRKLLVIQAGSKPDGSRTP